MCRYGNMLYSIVFRRAIVPMITQGVSSLKRRFTEPFQRKDGNYYTKLTLEDKRKEYKCGRRYKTLEHVTPWSEWRLKQKLRCESGPLSEINQVLNEKVSIWQGDVTQLEIDAIVNAANRSLLGGGGVDGAIHSAAGWSLRHECEELNGCQPGNAKLTSGHRLPAKYILHTVGPMNEDRDVLKSCYENCLKLVDEHNIKSVAFCCVATGVYGFPNEDAAHVALETVRSWLETEDHHEKIERIIFCVFLDIDYKIYQRLMQVYFPREEDIPKDEEIPSVEMLQKRLNSLREIPVTSEDDTEGSKTNEPSPMEVQENIQTESEVTLSTQEGSKNSPQEVVDEHSGRRSFDLDRSDGQHFDDKSVSEDNKNNDTPFTEKDNTKDGKISNDTESSAKDHEDDALSSETSQKDNISSPEKDQKANSPSSKSPNNMLLQNSSSQKDIDQLPSQDMLQKDETPPPEETKNDNTPPPEETTDDDISPTPKDDENMVNTQDTQQSSPTDESLKPPSTAEQSGEGDTQLPILQKSVSEPAKQSVADEDQ